VLRQGKGEPLILLHGVLQSARTWRNVVPSLAANFEVIVPTELGHLGGRTCDTRSASLADVVDDAERILDELGVDKAHLAGNSMGGWVALELAKRGRAETVCAFSTAGAWDRDWNDKRRVFRSLRNGVRRVRRLRRLLPIVSRFASGRRLSMTEVACHGDRLAPADYVDMAEDMLGCSILEDIIDDWEEAQLAPFESPPCPITLAWPKRDQVFPVDTYGARARQMIPAARFVLLDDVGHIPMIDDPKLVVDTVIEATKAPASGDQANQAPATTA